MPQSTALRPPHVSFRAVALAVLTVALAVATVTAVAAGQHQTAKRVAGEAEIPGLGKTVLTTTKGRTLYSLSVEKNGKFVCTASCLSVWHPLIVARGVKPTGPVKLGTIARPEGGRQVTYSGRPLYRFGGDAKAGDVNGEGIEDVGTWHAAAVPQAGSNSQPPAETPPSEPSPPSAPYEPPPPYGGY